MENGNYILIDKSIIAEGCAYDFSIYYFHNKSKIKKLQNKGVVIDSDDLLYFEQANKLYVHAHEHSSYKKFMQENFVGKSGNPVSFASKFNSIYKNASKALNDLFDNPEKLSNYKESKKIVNELVESVLDDDFAIKSLMEIATHDYYTHTHSINVSIYALSLGNFLSLSTKELEELGEAALLHDLGKSKIDSNIINKKGSLTIQEFKIMKKHPSFGVSIGLKLGIKNKNILEGIKYHHEKMDGSGYPNGLYNDEIPLYAKIICICDIFDALTSQRSYKQAMTSYEALKLMKVEMNRHIDLKLLNKMILMFK
ncbi:HD-GYP domain-containing protein [Sulfurimonas lithotrophica]|uniref:HD-GYP domain-containing protein n=1 Tax=Sulfurimonas lithotrophica TaxID=2590022 RepID=A0A5P8NYK9_9BACT|nr:HD-GYP domain-containing protein [Sulfurimonas lithotrophica]QFR48525.1 HD-GYP domain-containing protein [Sulfurimonas lithotrophica]